MLGLLVDLAQKPRLECLYYSFVQTGSSNGADVPESLKNARKDLALLRSQQSSINNEVKNSARLSMSDIPSSATLTAEIKKQRRQRTSSRSTKNVWTKP